MDEKRLYIAKYWSNKETWQVRDELDRMGVKYEKTAAQLALVELLVDEITTLNQKYAQQPKKEEPPVVASVSEFLDPEAQEAALKRKQYNEWRERIEGKPQRSSPPPQRLTDIWQKELALRQQSLKGAHSHLWVGKVVYTQKPASSSSSASAAAASSAAAAAAAAAAASSTKATETGFDRGDRGFSSNRNWDDEDDPGYTEDLDPSVDPTDPEVAM